MGGVNSPRPPAAVTRARGKAKLCFTVYPALPPATNDFSKYTAPTRPAADEQPALQPWLRLFRNHIHANTVKGSN